MLEISAVVARKVNQEIDVLLVNTREKLTLSPAGAVALAEQLQRATQALTDSPEPIERGPEQLPEVRLCYGNVAMRTVGLQLDGYPELVVTPEWAHLLAEQLLGASRWARSQDGLEQWDPWGPGYRRSPENGAE